MKPALVVMLVAGLASGVGSAVAQPMLGGMPGANAGPTEVGVVTLEAQSVPITTVLPGRVSASMTADVRPQVGGIITAVQFREGERVGAGQVLFTVDAATYEAEVAVAEANVRTAEAQIPSAQATVDRYESLVGSGGISQTELDTARATLAQAEANLASAQAQLRVAQISLDNATIKAPIAGTIGKSQVQVGSLVTASQTDALATIRVLDPVEIELAESSANLLRLRQAIDAGTLEGSPDRLTVTLTLEDGSTYGSTGMVESADIVVSETTGSFVVRVSMPNPDGVLMPGMFVRATVAIGQQPNAFLVPQRAVTFDADGNPTAYFVNADGTAEQRVLTSDRSLDNAWVVTGGVEPGDRLIVDGLQKISDGVQVSAVAVTIEDNGVVYQEPPRNVAATEEARP